MKNLSCPSEPDWSRNTVVQSFDRAPVKDADHRFPQIVLSLLVDEP